MPPAALAIVSGMLILGAAPMPYGYYSLLRLVACAGFVWAAMVAYEKRRQVVPWVFAVLALLFNPLFKVHLPKDTWAVIDFASGLLLLVNFRLLNAGSPKGR